MSTTTESFLVGLIGTGVVPSLTPPMHEGEADRQGLRYLYRPLDLEVMGRAPEEVGDILREAGRLGFNACNITSPVKELAVAHLDTMSAQVRCLGATNTVLIRDGKLHGENTDVTGFGEAFDQRMQGAPRERVVLFGAGGAGSAVATALLEAGVRELSIVDVAVGRAQERAERLASVAAERGATVTGQGSEAVAALLGDADGVVNATFMGMHNHPGTPFDLDLLRPEHWVADIVYRPVRTRLVEQATRLGCRILDGGHMACGQAIDAFRPITGRPADAAAVRSDFDALIRAEAMTGGAE